MTAPHSPPLISVAALATQKGWNRTTAWRYLTRLERESGAKLIRQRRTLYIAADELARVVASSPARKERQTSRELAAVRRRLADVESRQKTMEAEMRDFRRKAHRWFTGVE